MNINKVLWGSPYYKWQRFRMKPCPPNLYMVITQGDLSVSKEHSSFQVQTWRAIAIQGRDKIFTLFVWINVPLLWSSIHGVINHRKMKCNKTLGTLPQQKSSRLSQYFSFHWCSPVIHKVSATFAQCLFLRIYRHFCCNILVKCNYTFFEF